MSLAVRAGEMVTLLGRNGMGKTTTIRSMMGLTPARAGAIRFAGHEARQLPSFRIAQLGIGLVPEGRQIFPNLTVRENLVAASGNRLGNPDPWTWKKSTRCSRGCPSAAPIWAARCPAASSRCWRSAAR